MSEAVTVDRPTCATCPYWEEVPEQPSQGICRHHAPGARVVSEQIMDMTYPLWPSTLDDEWCGDHPDFPEYLARWKHQRGRMRDERADQ